MEQADERVNDPQAEFPHPLPARALISFRLAQQLVRASMFLPTKPSRNACRPAGSRPAPLWLGRSRDAAPPLDGTPGQPGGPAESADRFHVQIGDLRIQNLPAQRQAFLVRSGNVSFSAKRNRTS